MHRKMYVIALALYLSAWRTAVAYKPLNFSEMKPDSGGGSGSYIILPITGSVYPLGYYTVAISIGNPPKYSFVLDIDIGSDLTWARCSGSGNPTNPQDRQNEIIGTVVTCGDEACKSLGALGYGNNNRPRNEKCEYRVGYADGSSSAGVLVRDSIPLTLSNGTTAAPNLTFGCEVPQTKYLSNQDGVLGLGKGEASILKQLSKMGVVRNVFGHCFSGTGGGYLFLGDLPIPGVTWKQMSSDHEHRYYLGSADIFLGGNTTDIIRGLGIILDSGSTYTYLASQAYDTFLDRVKNKLYGKVIEAVEDKTLPVCWQYKWPILTFGQVASYLFPVTLSFTDENIVQFEMLPESYLINVDKKIVCLGILNGTAAGLEDMNLIGEISMQNKLVIYDNDKETVGWTAVDTCERES